MTKVETIGIVLRFPIFLLIICFRVFIAAPFEFIVKIVTLGLFVLVSILKYRWAVTFRDNSLYEEWLYEWREGLRGFFKLGSFDFKSTIRFLKYGKFAKA